MRVAIVGAWNRSEAEDFDLVNELIAKLGSLYPALWVVTYGCDRGIGKIVKNRCMPKERGGEAEFFFAEVAIHIYAKGASSASLAQFWQARNASLFEVAEEFHIFMDKSSHQSSQMQDLLQRVKEAGRPHSVYEPGDKDPKMVKM